MKAAVIALAVLACQVVAQTPRTAERQAALPLDLVEKVVNCRWLLERI